MFDGGLPEIGELASCDDAAVVEAIGAWVRVENAAAARKLAAMAELLCRRIGLGSAAEREAWFIDPEAAVTTELGAAAGISRWLAGFQAHRGLALRDRLPQVGALFAAGSISDELVRTIIARTGLITDAAVIAAVDTELAAQVRCWGALSRKKTETAIDAIVDAHDPAALKRARDAALSCDIEFGAPTDPPGMTTLWARLLAGDAAALEARVSALADTVCPNDPRSTAERRAHALSALADNTPLACGCGRDDCSAPTTAEAAPPTNTTVYVITEPDTLTTAHTTNNRRDHADNNDGDGDDDDDSGGDTGNGGGGGGGPEPTADPTPDTDAAATPPQPQPAPASASDGHPPPPGTPASGAASASGRAPGAGSGGSAPEQAAPLQHPWVRPAFVLGAGILPAPLLAALLHRAKITTVAHPGPTSTPQPRYTPSPALAAFIRCRDMTCRFPGCDHPAQHCDIDHAVPYPLGPTHPSNLRCLCRFHHLLKTFWTGATGWTDRQHPDATIDWTSPTGHTYTTRPGAAHYFPQLCRPTGDLWTEKPPPVPRPGTHHGINMPKRRHTRAQDRDNAITHQRQLNNDYATHATAERNKPPPWEKFWPDEEEAAA